MNVIIEDRTGKTGFISDNLGTWLKGDLFPDGRDELSLTEREYEIWSEVWTELGDPFPAEVNEEEARDLFERRAEEWDRAHPDEIFCEPVYEETPEISVSSFREQLQDCDDSHRQSGMSADITDTEAGRLADRLGLFRTPQEAESAHPGIFDELLEHGSGTAETVHTFRLEAGELIVTLSDGFAFFENGIVLDCISGRGEGREKWEISADFSVISDTDGHILSDSELREIIEGELYPDIELPDDLLAAESLVIEHFADRTEKTAAEQLAGLTDSGV